jgi:hypothetical protein
VPWPGTKILCVSYGWSSVAPTQRCWPLNYDKIVLSSLRRQGSRYVDAYEEEDVMVKLK